MDKNSQDSPPPKTEKPEKRSPPLGNNLIWYLLALGVGTLFLASLMGQKGRVRIDYSDLERLIEKGAPTSESAAKEPGKKAPEKQAEPWIEVTEGADGNEVTVRYSNLDKLKFGQTEITGTVTRQIVAPIEKKNDPQPETSFATPRLGLERDDNALYRLAVAKGFTKISADEAQSGWRYYASMFIFMLLFILIFFFMLRRLGGAGSAIAFGRSRGKLYAQEDIGVTFNDIAGIDEAVDELREVVEFLKTPEKFRVLGGRIPKGVLLVGPPGTGKTLLAKAIAGEAGVPFFSLSGSDFVEMFVGVGAARVRDMFQQAQVRAPCIVFIDELDALGKTRGTSVVGGHDEREQTLNALLVEMDGFTNNSGVIVLAATNRPETLDPALLRPGRFDRHVLVDRPDVRGREAILKVHIKEVKLDDTVDLKELAGITSGFVGADLANLVNEAALLAARRNKQAVTMSELTEAVERVTTGLEKRQRVMHEDEKQRVAYHESAHALVAYCLPNTDPVHKVSIIPRGLAALGYTMQRPEGDRYLVTQSELESRVQVLLAGTVAEEMVFSDVSTGAQNDLERATEIARSMVMEFGMSRLGRVNFRESSRSVFLSQMPDLPHERHHSEQTAREIDQEIKRIIDESLEKVRRILETRRKALVALAQRLIEREVIDTDELRKTIEAASPSPAIVPGTADAPKRPAGEPAEEPKLPETDAKSV
jgi:cell division protease FtsH